MNGQQLNECMRLLHAWWPSGPWTEDTERAWLLDLQSVEFDYFTVAAKRLHETVESTFTPPFATFSAAVGELRARDENARKAALPAPPVTDEVKANRLRWVRALREAMGGGSRDRDERARGGFRTGGHDHRHGAEGCPVCSKHDHSDQRVFGYSLTPHYAERPDSTGQYRSTIVREEVRADHFTCPACGDPQTAQYLIADWTEAGRAFMKAQGITVTGSA